MVFWGRIICSENQLDADIKSRGNEAVCMQACLLGLKIIPHSCIISLPIL